MKKNTKLLVFLSTVMAMTGTALTHVPSATSRLEKDMVSCIGTSQAISNMMVALKIGRSVVATSPGDPQAVVFSQNVYSWDRVEDIAWIYLNSNTGIEIYWDSIECRWKDDAGAPLAPGAVSAYTPAAPLSPNSPVLAPK